MKKSKFDYVIVLNLIDMDILSVYSCYALFNQIGKEMLNG
jgi:hypothetical protein